ncbi:flagellar component of cell-distal portion of basal-body rod [Sterolibacterium denitrificans]|uniref:Flagellar basal-body rod protein FlgG n=2 Tax=Sterolibacterium denitrificans TaxID=157592 RepID=A0A656Z8L6_9PROT|nr:flagellar basal-body rod protein FlgG [Sterolibacterium denitrificans]KYC29314.1 flagellar basal body rod protein FlgG [Sterolibacterium denitrificans]SMB30709.1 flagellar component of cell-distal portion of basal-body rod [Sterolibacterium denitrificans]
MIRSLWIAKTGLDAQQTQLDVIANNLSNVSTNGYKRAHAVFEDLLYQTMRQPGAQSSQQTTIPSGLQLGTGVRPVATEKNFGQGNLNLTNNPLDIAINGQGFFQIEMPDGTLAYTRDGAFQKDSTGLVVTSSGYPLSPALTIPPDALSITIGRDGVVSVVQAGAVAPTEVGTIQISSFVNPGGLQSVGENFFVETASSGTPSPNTPGTNGTGVLNQGYVEASNVNMAEELVTMIQTQRAYEMNSKVISTSDQMLAKLANL